MSRYKTDSYREKHAAYARGWRAKNGARNQKTQVRYRKKNPSQYRATQINSDLMKHYGITTFQRDEMFAAQGFRCAICNSTTSKRKGQNFAVDHCHGSGKVRGILCHHCNAVLGYARDDKKILIAAISYLEKAEREA